MSAEDDPDTGGSPKDAADDESRSSELSEDGELDLAELVERGAKLPPEAELSREELIQWGAARFKSSSAALTAALLEYGAGRYLKPVIRPPGASVEIDFLMDCTRCGLCVEACPPNALRLFGPEAGYARGTPYLDPNNFKPCAACYDVPCAEVCPTEALEYPMEIKDAVMGLAVLNRETCLSWQGTACDRCNRACPFPDVAIVWDEDGRPYIDPRHCIGCGRCVLACPSEPISLEIKPPSLF